MKLRARLGIGSLWLLSPATAFAHDGSLVFLAWAGVIVPITGTLCVVLFSLLRPAPKLWLAALVSAPLSAAAAWAVLQIWAVLDSGTDFMPNELAAAFVFYVLPLIIYGLITALIYRLLVRGRTRDLAA